MTQDHSEPKPKTTFWESLTGQRFKLGDTRIKQFYRSIGCVFNHKSFYANIQPDDMVKSTIFDLNDDSLWKAMDYKIIKSLPKVPMSSIMPSDIDIIEEEVALEKALKSKIAGVRFSECGLKSKWDK